VHADPLHPRRTRLPSSSRRAWVGAQRQPWISTKGALCLASLPSSGRPAASRSAVGNVLAADTLIKERVNTWWPPAARTSHASAQGAPSKNTERPATALAARRYTSGTAPRNFWTARGARRKVESPERRSRSMTATLPGPLAEGSFAKTGRSLEHTGRFAGESHGLRPTQDVLPQPCREDRTSGACAECWAECIAGCEPDVRECFPVCRSECGGQPHDHGSFVPQPRSCFPGFGPPGNCFYGNWCGPGCGSGPLVDALDACCQAHDCCYDLRGWGACSCDREFVACASPLALSTSVMGSFSRLFVGIFAARVGAAMCDPAR